MTNLVEPNDETIDLEETDAEKMLTRLSPSLIEAAEFLPLEVAADLVRTYYSVQEQRLKMDNQIRATRVMVCPSCGESLSKVRSGKPVAVRIFTCSACETEAEDVIDVRAALFVREGIAASEERAKKLLDRWTQNSQLAQWARSVVGIGPVLSAGLLAEVDPAKSAHVSSLWRFAGYDPTAVWEKGQKRPYNAFLKVLCWRIGDSFVKVSGKEHSLYGKAYRVEKDRLEEINDNGGFAEAAAERIASGVRVPRPGTDARTALDNGRLPKAQIDLRARRKAVKLFLSHYWVQARMLNDLPVSEPYAIAKLGHQHLIEPEVPYIS